MGTMAYMLVGLKLQMVRVRVFGCMVSVVTRGHRYTGKLEKLA